MITKSLKTLQEVCCASCKEPLPGQKYWKGRILICDKSACREAVKSHGRGLNKFIPINTVKCAWPDCTSFVPEGFVLPQVKEPSCSEACYRRLIYYRESLVCLYCGRAYRGNQQHEATFCCPDHAHKYRVEQRMKKAGIFLPTIIEYLELYAKEHRRAHVAQQRSLVLFCEFLTGANITDLEVVTPKTVSEFLAWGMRTGRGSVWHAVWYVSSFMKWLGVMGKRKAANPVIPRFHSRTKATLLPRPFSKEEMAQIWTLLNQRGTLQTKLAVAIAEESGLRISELCNLRVQDIDLKRMALFVRLPNKTMKEAWVPFHERTYELVTEWLAKRDKNVAHDYLLHNELGRAYNNQSLHKAISKAVCKTFKGVKYNEDGLDSWSTHRLRHTMASRLVAAGADAATVMAVGRWDSFENMCGYALVDHKVAARGYHEAMERAKANESSASKRSSGFLHYVKKASPEGKSV